MCAADRGGGGGADALRPTAVRSQAELLQTKMIVLVYFYMQYYSIQHVVFFFSLQYLFYVSLQDLTHFLVANCIT
ncbi:hypothetical protein STCU_11523 [Strigomonas culicis]|uniref:Uncharacterized protein n=1 Tax=Strigomonas culicis TaxID=28005 RepID=S9UNA4_9TRYP|nr:hypothetical protein STCU_11523 [Strigomonas culicis]|eukprot:EPY16141.1 hypothetical protein STCU_11523 [Strigomonas culicis]